MDVDPHENFPIVSVSLPKALRAAAGIIYQVVRITADTHSVRRLRGGTAHRGNATVQTRRRGGAFNRG